MPVGKSGCSVDPKNPASLKTRNFFRKPSFILRFTRFLRGNSGRLWSGHILARVWFYLDRFFFVWRSFCRSRRDDTFPYLTVSTSPVVTLPSEIINPWLRGLSQALYLRSTLRKAIFLWRISLSYKIRLCFFFFFFVFHAQFFKIIKCLQHKDNYASFLLRNWLLQCIKIAYGVSLLRFLR